MAGQIIISNIKTDSDNAFSILANTGAVLFSANLASGITTGIADGSVTNAKLAGSITGDKIATGQITGNLIATGQITGNLIATNAISQNNIVSVNASVASVGTLPTARLPAGTVLQVVRTTITTQASYTLNAGAIQSTALTASITPISSSSHVIVQMMASINSSGAGQGVYGEIRRGTSTTLNQGAGGGSQNYPIHWINTQNLANIGSGGTQLASQGWLAFDSPATTSSTSYTFYVYGVSGAGPLLLNAFNGGTASSVILLWEIAG